VIFGRILKFKKVAMRQKNVAIQLIFLTLCKNISGGMRDPEVGFTGKD
jgi:hypothetical protein